MFEVLDSFLSFLRTYEKKKAYNMLSLMFDLRFKNLHLVSSYYVGKKQEVFIGEQYDRKAFYPMLVTMFSSHTITYILLKMFLVLYIEMLIEIKYFLDD